ncbi:MAG: hypothetical protein EKK41_05060 [Hyphomicrobiales bacterium]|nr:MAG: hypothetical protein EKK41_05060 [Hyphomicrobiales bacterium]
MKYFLIITLLYWDGAHEVSSVDLTKTGQNIVECNRLGDHWAKWYLTKNIKGITLVRYECIEDGKQ